MGASHARLLVAEGAKVVIGDILDDEGAALAAELGERGALRAPRRDEAVGLGGRGRRGGRAIREARRLGQQRRDHRLRAAQDVRPDKWQQVLDVNVTGTLLGIQAVVDPMNAAGGGSIVNISSIEGLRGAAMGARYVTSKWAVRGLTKSAALELAPQQHPGQLDPSGVHPHGDDREASPGRAQHPVRAAGRAAGGVGVRALSRQRRVVVCDRGRIRRRRRSGGGRFAQGVSPTGHRKFGVCGFVHLPADMSVRRRQALIRSGGEGSVVLPITKLGVA